MIIKKNEKVCLATKKENNCGQFTYHDQIKRLTQIDVALFGEKKLNAYRR